MKTIKKIFSLTEKTIMKFDKLMEQGTAATNSELIAALIDKAYSDNFETNDKTISDIETQLKRIIAVCNENNQMIYQNRDTLNSLSYFYELQEYYSADGRTSNGKPHDVMKTALTNYKKHIHAKSLQKSTEDMLKDKEDE